MGDALLYLQMALAEKMGNTFHFNGNHSLILCQTSVVR